MCNPPLQSPEPLLCDRMHVQVKQCMQIQGTRTRSKQLQCFQEGPPSFCASDTASSGVGMCPVLRQASSRLMTAPRASAVGGAAACSGFLTSCAASSDALSESPWTLHHNHKQIYGTAACSGYPSPSRTGA